VSVLSWTPGISVHACTGTVYILLRKLDCLKAWSELPTGVAALGLSYDILLHPCLHVMLAVYIEPP